MNFIEEVLKRKEYMEFLFNHEEDYEGSSWEKEIPKFSNFVCKNPKHLFEYKKNKFVAENAKWIFVDTKGNVYGVLNNFVVYFDDEGQLFYLCNGFQNIPLSYFEILISLDTFNDEKDYLLKEKNIDLDKFLEEYKDFCSSFSLEVSLNHNENEFEQYLKDNVK